MRFRAGARVWTPVARVHLNRDRTLTAEDIEWASAVAWGPPAESDLRVAAGWTTRRPINAGEPLVPPAVAVPKAITAGAQVTVVFDTGPVTIEVHDRGPGIPSEIKDRIFQPFVTTKTRGTGLGLAMVRRLVDEHNGEIAVESEEGAGTHFTVKLPQLSVARRVAGSA